MSCAYENDANRAGARTIFPGTDDISKPDRHPTQANGHNGEDVALTLSRGVNEKRDVCATDARKAITERLAKSLFDCVTVAAAAFYRCSGGNCCKSSGGAAPAPRMRLCRRDAAQIRGD